MVCGIQLNVELTSKRIFHMTSSRKRHGCLTAWLIYMLIGNSFAALVNLLLSFAINTSTFKSIAAQQALPNISSVTYLILTVVCIFNVVCTIVLFKWKKWGFYGCLGSAVVAFIINILSGINLVTSLLGLLGLAMLYGVLNIGGENKAWTRLE
jgi:uncharacterized membrane protein YjjP (DUF1212 family)